MRPATRKAARQEVLEAGRPPYPDFGIFHSCVPFLLVALVVLDEREEHRPRIAALDGAQRAGELADEIILMHRTVIAAELLDQHVDVDERRSAARRMRAIDMELNAFGAFR